MARQTTTSDNAIIDLDEKSSESSDRIRSGVAQTLDLLFPPTCQGCGAITADRERNWRGFCFECETDLLAHEIPCCLGCAAPLPLLEFPNAINGNDQRQADQKEPPTNCPVCREEGWKFEETIALGPYRDLLRHLILKSKQRSGLSTAHALGNLLARHRFDRFAKWREQGPMVLVPIPSHWSRRWVRGGNSPDAVVTGLAETLRIKSRNHLVRVRRTTKQTELAPSRRVANVRSAFKIRNAKQLRGKRVLLVDDIFTTGSTLSEATKELLRAGAGQVIVVVLAKRIERL